MLSLDPLRGAVRTLEVAALLSLAAGYCAVAKRNGKQPAKANAEP